MDNNNEVEKFLGDLTPSESKLEDIFHQEEKKEEIKEEVEGKEEEVSEGRKNRRHRRLEEQLQKERESNIALNERIKVLAEVDSVRREYASDEMPAEWVALYGDTPEAQKAWKLQERLLSTQREQAKEEAIREFEERQQNAINEQKQYESQIDSELEGIEDEYDVDLTSNAPKARKMRKEFLELVQNLSPKDEDGTITGYADFQSAFALFQKTHPEEKVDNSRQKEISSRSIQKTGPVNTSKEETDATADWLRRNGIRI